VDLLKEASQSASRYRKCHADDRKWWMAPRAVLVPVHALGHLYVSLSPGKQPTEPFSRKDPRFVIRGYTHFQSRSGTDLSMVQTQPEGVSLERPIYPIKEAGVDWLTVTCQEGDTQAEFDSVGYSLLHTESELGCKLMPWYFENFEGLNAGHIAFGKRDSLSLMRMSSSVAWAYWRKAYELSTNCSRIDFQVTFEDVTEPDELILEAHKDALVYVSNMKRPTEVDLRLSNRRGPTLYLGMRTSARFGRLYNKFRESKLKHYSGCVRAEMQVNGKAAVFAARALLQSGRDPHDVIPFVSGFFSSRGVSPYWPTVSIHMFHVPRKRSSAASRLRWIQAQVAPAVRSLIDDGYLRATLEALNLTEMVGPLSAHDGPTLEEME
jgi:hypothetical protein